MATGKVKWFNNAKGYGFILAHTGGEDLFVHYSSIQMDGYRTLKAGQNVEFDIQQGPKGMHAVNIRLDPAYATSDEADGEAQTGTTTTASRPFLASQDEMTESSR